MAEPAAPLLCIVGPTATGKTGLAVEIAQRWAGEIVGCDASQVYRGLDIGTGKATAEELGGVPHHLIDIVEPDEAFDAAAYVRAADAAIADIRARGRHPIVCGGTGLWLRALLHGLCEAPPVSPDIVAELRARIDAGEVESLHAELAEVDPDAAARIAGRDRQRIERALGVYRTTGRPLTDWQAAHRFADARHPAVLVGLDVPQAELRERIERRVQGMLDAGLVAEVRGLVEGGYGPVLRSMSAIGYRAMAAHVDGAFPLERAVELMMRDTRRYAKRQRTWFRRQAEVTWWTPPVEPTVIDSYVRAIWELGGR